MISAHETELIVGNMVAGLLLRIDELTERVEELERLMTLILAEKYADDPEKSYIAAQELECEHLIRVD